MQYSFGTMSIDSLEISNDSLIKLKLLSDYDGELIANVVCHDVFKFEFHSAVTENERCDPIFIMDFLIDELNPNERNEFNKSYWYKASLNIEKQVKYKIELHGASIYYCIYCSKITFSDIGGVFKDSILP